jgi:hypothetical protein
MTENSDINIFNVHYKTLELTNYEIPSDRSTYYQITNLKNKDNLLNKNYLLSYCDLINPLCNHIYWLSQDFFEDKAAEDYSYEDIESFLERLDEVEFNAVLKKVNEWIDSNIDETDFESTPRYYPKSGYSYAFYLFEGNSRNLCLFDHIEFDVEEVAEALDINIVEGDHPGSNYIGAELGIPVDKANEIAKQKGFPIHFVKIS